MNNHLLFWGFFLVWVCFYSTVNSHNQVAFIQPNKLQFTNSQNRKLEIVINGLGKSKLNFSGLFDKVWSAKLAESDASIKLTQTRARSTDNDSDEYRFVWKKAHQDNGATWNIGKEICVNYALGDSFWYHTFVDKEFSVEFPLNAKNIKQSLFTTNESPNTANANPMLEHLFYNTHGFALLLSDVHPWEVGIDGDGSLCFSLANASIPQPDFGYFSSIDIRIAMARDIRSVYQSVVNELGWIKRPKVVPQFATTVWSITGVKDDNCRDILTNIHKIELTDSIIFVENWSKSMADLNPPTEVSECFKSAHWYGERVGLEIKFESSMTTVPLYNLETVNEFADRLFRLTRTNEIESILSALNGLVHEDDEFLRKYPSFIKTQLAQVSSTFTRELVVQSAYKSQAIPGFVRFNVQLGSSIVNFKSLISQALVLSLAGYQFISPMGILLVQSTVNLNRVLYIRWIQAIVFMPQMVIPAPPWTIVQEVKMGDVQTTIDKIFLDLVKLRQNFIIPTLKKLAENWIQSGEPIIRPMWYAHPNEKTFLDITDQYMLGNDLVIAPMINWGSDSRDVYLPSGKWRDNTVNHSIHIGPGVINHFLVPIDIALYFVRVG